MNKKRTLLTALALILVCALSIMGTAAYLKAQTTTVTNTFIAAGGPDPVFVNVFELKEYQVTQAGSGKYTQTQTEVDANSYSVQQGTTIPKQAFVKLQRTTNDTTATPAPAYLYIEVIDGLEAQYSWSVDAANWTKLNGFVGPNGGDIYVYSGALANNKVLTTVAAGTKIDIVADDQIMVADETLSTNTITLKFNAYLTQATVGESDDPATVFKACFDTTDVTNP